MSRGYDDMSARLSLAPDDLHLVAPLSAGWFTFFQILLLVLLDEAVAMCAAAFGIPTNDSARLFCQGRSCGRICLSNAVCASAREC